MWSSTDKKLYQSTGSSRANTGSTKGILISALLVKKELLKPEPFQVCWFIILVCLYGGSHFVTENMLAVNQSIYMQTINFPEIFWGTLNVVSIATRKIPLHKLFLRFTWTKK